MGPSIKQIDTPLKVYFPKMNSLRKDSTGNEGIEVLASYAFEGSTYESSV
jgi:hypothetical protein